MANSNTLYPVFIKLVSGDGGLPAVATPDAVIAFVDNIIRNKISTKSNFYTISGGVAEIVFIEVVVITATLAIIHGGLPGP